MSNDYTLNKLQSVKNQGVTINDFPAGFRLAARVKDLRNKGYEIITAKEYDYSSVYERVIARYTLIKGI